MYIKEENFKDWNLCVKMKIEKEVNKKIDSM